jgi:AcrR family transcriptional regulator
MRIRDERKRLQITQTAARLFAAQPYGKVRLEDVASAAGVGKGTVYIYFKSKEELYYSLAFDGFAATVERAKNKVAANHASAIHQLEMIVRELVDFSISNPQLYEVQRIAGLPSSQPQWNSKRIEMAELIEQVIRGGVQQGELADAEPALTALFIPSLIRAVMLHGPKELDPGRLTGHIMHILKHGLCRVNCP